MINATTLASSGSSTTMVNVTTVSAIMPNATTAAPQSIASTRRHFSSCNSTANSSARFCTVASAPSAARRSESNNPSPSGGGVSSMILSPRHQHADEQADAKRNADGLIRMFADDLVGRLRAGDRLLLQPQARILGSLERTADALTHLVGLVTRHARGGGQPFFRVADHSFQVGDEAIRSEEHTSELQSPYVISYAVFC